MKVARQNSQSQSATPLTDALLEKIANRLTWYGARAAAARYAGLSRQNFGKLLRERGVPRDSEVLLRLDEFSRLSAAGQRKLAGKPAKTSDALPPQAEEPVTESSLPPNEYNTEELPPWML